MLEYFVHLDADDPPPDLILASADIPDELDRERIDARKLPGNWREIPASAELARYGDEFVRRAKCCLLLVPSALALSENNWLINPLHLDFRKIEVREAEQFSYDARLFQRERRGRKHK
jgi:RES domain-containing protein